MISAGECVSAKRVGTIDYLPTLPDNPEPLRAK
jgi:hypothetical protein